MRQEDEDWLVLSASQTNGSVRISTSQSGTLDGLEVNFDIPVSKRSEGAALNEVFDEAEECMTRKLITRGGDVAAPQ